MKRIFRLYFLFLIPFFLIRWATLSETDLSTGLFTGEKYGHTLYLISIALAVIISLSAAVRFFRNKTVPEVPGSPALGMQILFSLTALFSLQQLLIPPLTSQIESKILSNGIYIFYAVSHILCAAFFFLLAKNTSLPSSSLTDLFAASPAIAFTSQMLFLYAQKPINIHDSLSVVSLLCEGALAIAWLRYCSALLAGSSTAFPSAVGFSVFALFMAVGFRLPLLFFIPGIPSFLMIISVLHHVFASLTLMFMVLAAIPDQRRTPDPSEETEDGDEDF